VVKLKDILLTEADVFGNTSSSDDTSKVEDKIEDAFKDLGKEFKSADLEPKNVDEAIGMTLAGVALSAPEILKLLGKFVNVIKRIPGFKKLSGDRLIELGDKYHHIIMGGIESALKRMGVKDTAKAKKWANIAFHVVIALMLVAGGLAAFKYYSKGAINATALKSALNAVKANEIKKYIVTAAAAI
jgi:hypothetical protein